MFEDSSVVVLLTLAAYLVGSLSFAVIVSRVMGLDDPRTYGSQNPGATNVLRSGNKQAAMATLLFDALKGYLPVLLVKWHGPAFGLDDRAVALVAISAFIGHLWPVFFAFKGGKGVATAAGILFGVEPLLGAAVMGTWLIVAFFFRYSSLAALAASLFAPAYYLFGHQIAWQTSDAELLAVTVMSALLLMRHKDNIARLVSGQETKIGAKKDAPTEEAS
ncbi:glycerol-3-phosphate 1-O-acyltransferase PlsY [Limnohabitans sp.]|uniref:glycerol-3-phosphate 1-O-acyltransferase PlsY n=1 Tax=Limnohabitans sp. TaxID=1907725 RepID=UPI00286EE227|nr:glycerol-3-phosphate 1-O-acyltransferase PlsY [Limnohabitans sp.]